MPEVGIPETPFIKRVEDHVAKKDPYFIWDIDLLKLARKGDEHIIGHGAECIVTEMKGEPDKVVAFAYYGLKPEEVKRIFYSQRVFSVLFPHNFPHFYAAFGATDAPGSLFRKKYRAPFPTGTIRHRITTSEEVVSNPPQNKLNTLKRFFRLGNEKPIAIPTPEVIYPMANVDKFCQDLDLGLVGIDTTGGNTLIGQDGGEYYVDTVRFYPEEWDKKKIITYMQQNGYSDSDQRMVSMSIGRLAQLSMD